MSALRESAVTGDEPATDEQRPILKFHAFFIPSVFWKHHFWKWKIDTFWKLANIHLQWINCVRGTKAGLQKDLCSGVTFSTITPV